MSSEPYVELDGGVVTGGSDPARIGKVRYYIDLIDEDGARLGVWDGSSYDDACDVLAEYRQDGMRTVDLLRSALQ